MTPDELMGAVERAAFDAGATDRQLRLFACACARAYRWRAPRPDDGKVIAAAEMWADGVAVRPELLSAPHGLRVLVATRAIAAARFWAVATRAGIESQLPLRAAILHDIVGRASRSVRAGETARRIARMAYTHRAPDGTMDTVRLAVLSDAVEEAGVRDGRLLEHLRSPGPHVRGCWAVDCLLGGLTWF